MVDSRLHPTDRACWNSSPQSAEGRRLGLPNFLPSLVLESPAASLRTRSAESWGMPAVRLIKHEVIPKCGSFEVRFPDGAPSRYFYWDDLPSRRLRPDLVDGETALKQAKTFARVARERWSMIRLTAAKAPCYGPRSINNEK